MNKIFSTWKPWIGDQWDGEIVCIGESNYVTKATSNGLNAKDACDRIDQNKQFTIETIDEFVFKRTNNRRSPTFDSVAKILHSDINASSTKEHIQLAFEKICWFDACPHCLLGKDWTGEMSRPRERDFRDAVKIIAYEVERLNTKKALIIGSTLGNRFFLDDGIDLPEGFSCMITDEKTVNHSKKWIEGNLQLPYGNIVSIGVIPNPTIRGFGTHQIWQEIVKSWKSKP